MASKKKNKRELKCITFTYGGKRIYCYGKTLSEASEKAEKKKKELEEGSYKTGEDLTLDEYFEKWEEYREGTVTPATIASVRTQYGSIKKFEIDKKGHKLGQRKITEIDKNMIKNLQKKLFTDGMKTTSVNKRIKLLHRLLKEAVDDEIINKNPAEGIKPLKRTEAPARETIHRALSKEETAALLKESKDSWYYPLFLLLLNTGMRCGEAGAIRYSDIYDDYIYIRRTLTRSENNDVIMGKYPKTSAGVRDIPMTEAIREAIELQKKQNCIVNGGNIIDFEKPIFLSPRGLYLRGGNIDDLLRRICKRIGIEPISCHAFRDTFATRAIEGGMNMKTLQELLGHSDYSLTANLYCHVLPDTKKEEIKLVKII